MGTAAIKPAFSMGRALKSPNCSLSREAYQVVRQRILCGEFELGQQVSRRKIASELGMSFLPVSEALLRLESEGLLESRPRAGTRVRIPSPEDLDGHYIVREALETQAARLFAERATPEEKAGTLLLARQVDAAACGDRAEYLLLHQKLHSRIANLAGSKALSEAIERAHAVASAWLCLGREAGHGIRHEILVEKLTTLSPADAAEAMREHVRGAHPQALKRLTPYFGLRKATYTRGAKPALD